MRGRAIILASVVLNIVLGAWVVRHWRSTPPETSRLLRTMRHAAPGTNASPRVQTVVRQQFFIWSDVESEDYRTYIANLRDIACPESTIRDIIVADVTEFFERKRLREIVPEDPQWWRGNPQSEIALSITRQEAALDAQRRALLTELLGPGWEPARTRLSGMVFLTGPVLSALPEATKLAVQDILTRTAEREREAKREGKLEQDPQMRARLRQQTRSELARVLTPEQLEEYLVRWSFNASELRRRLAGIDVTPDQFRALFRATDALEQQLQLLSSGNDSVPAADREKLQQQIEDAVRRSLGAERYGEWKLNQDPVWTRTQELAARASMPTNLVRPVYEITVAGEEELRRIREDTTLTTAEQEEAIALALKDRADTLRELLGEETYRRFKEARPPALP